jgi:hypothetical protein
VGPGKRTGVDVALDSDTGDHAIILSSFELAKLAEASSGLADTLNVDLKTANSILQHVPIVVFEGMSEQVAGLVVRRMKKLTDAGCEFKISQPPLETQRKMRWPKPHRFVVEARQKAMQADAVERGPDGTFSFSCPKCGERLSVSLLGEPGKEKALLRSGGPAPEKPPKKPPISEIAERLAAMPEKKPAAAPAGAEGFMELDEFEAGLAELETDHGLMRPPETAGADDLPGESAQLIGFEELEEVGLEPSSSPVAGAGGSSNSRDIEAALRELDEDLPPVPDEVLPQAPSAGGGAALYNVILPQIRSEKKRGEAALVISRILQVPEEQALQMTNRVIVTVAKDVTADKAGKIKAAFEKHGFKVRVSKKK